MKIYKWFSINDEKKKEINKLRPIFIAGSRDISIERIKKLTQNFLKSGNVLWGCLEDEYINGLENSPQFKTLPLSKLEKCLEEVKSEKVNILRYFERDIKYILRELDFTAVIYINGSWYKSFHYNPHYSELISRKTPFKLISPFDSETEAKEYAKNIKSDIKIDLTKKYSEKELMNICKTVAKQSFDHTFQTGALLVKNEKIIITSFNSIPPFETYAMHYGALREKQFSPPNDANYYDTNHAEIEMIVKAGNEGIALEGCSLYVNLMPCPTCARAIAKTEIEEVVYELDHSDGYAVKLLESSGKKIKRVVP